MIHMYLAERSSLSGAENNIMLWFLHVEYLALMNIVLLTLSSVKQDLYKLLTWEESGSPPLWSRRGMQRSPYRTSAAARQKHTWAQTLLIICYVSFLKTKSRPLFRCFLWTRPGASKQITWSLYEGGPSDGVIKKDRKKKWGKEEEALEQNKSKERINTGKTKRWKEKDRG